MTLLVVVVVASLVYYFAERIWTLETIVGPDDLWKWQAGRILFITSFACGFVVVAIWGEWWETVVALVWFSGTIKEPMQDLILYWKNQ
jgi:hypothetical protein